MSKFEVGERVKHNQFGDGTVVDIATGRQPYSVKFDKFMYGHSCEKKCEYGYGWYCEESELTKLRKVSPRKKTSVNRDCDGKIDQVVIYNKKLNSTDINDIMNGNKTVGNRGEEMITPRETEVVKLICEGLRLKEVALKLGMSIRTAETHRKRVMKKLGVHSTVMVVRWAVKNKVVEV